MTNEAHAQIIEDIRGIMHEPDACERIVPTDIRILIGEIDRLRGHVKHLRSSMVFTTIVFVLIMAGGIIALLPRVLQ